MFGHCLYHSLQELVKGVPLLHEIVGDPLRDVFSIPLKAGENGAVRKLRDSQVPETCGGNSDKLYCPELKKTPI
jgi:hypothetical protein